MADSLAQNLNLYPMLSIELIVVDLQLWYFDVRRRKQLADAIDGRFPFRHVTPKPSAWQGPNRKTNRDLYDLCGARNTGIALARFGHVVLFDDCSILAPDWIYYHAHAARNQIALAGSFNSYTEATWTPEGIRGTLHPSGTDHRGPDAVRCSGGWLFGLNCSFPLEFALKVNGYDEKYSGQGGSEDCDFGVRLQRADCAIFYHPKCLVYQLLMQHDPVCDFSGWGQPQPRAQKEALLKDGKMHFANELLIQQLSEDTKRFLPTGNDFNLRNLREKALREGHKSLPKQRAIEVDWRDNQRLVEM